MSMEIITIDTTNHLWLEILQEIDHDVYNFPQYFQIEAKRTNTIPEACVIRENDKIFFAPYLLRQCNDISLESPGITDFVDIFSPYGYPGILVNYEAALDVDFLGKAIALLQQELEQKKVCSAFFRLHPILNQNISHIFPNHALTPNGQTVSIDLTLSESELWAHTRKGHQSTINKCKRLGFTARVVAFNDYYDEFLAIYEETMNRVNASDSYYFDDMYFRGLLSLDENLHLCIVELEQEIICASLFFESCGIIQAHLGGTRNDYIRQSPFNLLLHYMRLWGKERGNKYLHIGGGIGGSTDDSLYTFKSGFSRQRHDFFTLRLITHQQGFDELVKLRAKSLNVPIEDLYSSGFFPAYRAGI